MQRQEDDDALFAEANAWLFRLQADDVTEVDRAAFAAWRATGPAQERAWQEALGLMAVLKQPARAAHADAVSDIRRTRQEFRPKRRLTAVTAGFAAVLLVGIVAVQAPGFIDRYGADYTTPAGGRRSVTLADGTKVDLNSNTALALDFSSNERRVEVRRGEAFFNIAKDPRAFVVTAGGTQIRDIGTAFSVEHDARSQVIVTEGLVDVSNAGAAGAVRVAANQKVTFSGTAISRVAAVDPDNALAWRSGQIVFRQERLKDVVAQLNRYRRGAIVILNPGIADLQVSGVFEIDRPDRVIAALESVLDIQARSVSPWLVLLH